MHEVIIRTNSFETIVTVDAPLDTVNHYGYAYIINVDKVASSSYHENGTVGRLEVEQGHAVLESGSVVICPMDEDGSATVATITVKEGAKVCDEGDYAKDANGIATEHVEDCGAGHHSYGEKIVVDGKYMYEACKCCGYTLITVQDSSGNEVKQTKNTIDATTKKVTAEVSSPVETYLVSGTVNENPAAETVSNYAVSGDPIVETPKVEKELDQSACDHEFNEGVITTAPTCTSTGVKTYTCSKCGETYSITVAKAAHDYYDDVGQKHNSTETCKVCGQARTSEVAQIGTTTYTTLADAIAAVPTTGVATKITLLNDDAIEGNAGWIIAKTQSVVLDLNGYKLKNLVTEATHSRVIHNLGTLLIMDSSDIDKDGTGTGKIYCQSATEFTGSWPTWNWATNTILNDGGSLTISSGIIECDINGGLGYCIDSSSNSASCSLTINGGRLIGGNADQAIRLHYNAASLDNACNITGGVIESGGFWIYHNSGNYTGKCTLNISGGTINGMIDLKSNGNVAVNITGGTFNITKLRLRDSDTNATSDYVHISGGTINATSDFVLDDQRTTGDGGLEKTSNSTAVIDSKIPLGAKD